MIKHTGTAISAVISIVQSGSSCLDVDAALAMICYSSTQTIVIKGSNHALFQPFSLNS
jgi:hypothetical protein